MTHTETLENTMPYKSHTIIRTATIHANSGRPLYRIEGRYTKNAAAHPFITSISDARNWINEQLVADEMARHYFGIRRRT